MNYKVLSLVIALPLFAGCEVILDPPTPAPDRVSGLTYEEMENFGRMKFQKGEFSETRLPWGYRSSGLPTMCAHLARVYRTDGWHPPRSKIDYYTKECEQTIKQERRAQARWKEEVQQRYEAWKAKQIAQAEAEQRAEEERRQREAEEKQRIEQATKRMYERLATTTAYPRMKSLPEKSVVFPNAQHLGARNLGLVAGCFELAFEPSSVHYDQSNRTVSVYFANAQFPRGTMDVALEFIENDQYWLVNEANVNGRTSNRSVDLAYLLGSGMKTGGCSE